MMRRSLLNRPVAVLGQSMPLAALGLVVFVVLGSAFMAFASRFGLPALGLATLSPALVLRGHVWRLLSWAFFEVDGQSLIFGSLMLGFFGRDLAGVWGGARYLVTCAVVALGSGVLTTLVGLAWGDVYRTQYLSIWPIADALTVAWALSFPNRTILFMFVLPAAGRNLLYATVGITALFAIMYGFSNFVPHFLAMAVVYIYIRGGAVISAQYRLNKIVSPKRNKSHLKVVQGGWTGDNPKGSNGSGWVH